MAKRDGFEAATTRARRRKASMPSAVSARYDRRIGRVVIELSSGLEVAFSPRDAEGLEHARPAQLETIEIDASGYGLHFPELDADLYLPALLEGVFGSKRWLASRSGEAGGRTTRTAKAGAAGSNGTRGGSARRSKRTSAA